MTFADKLRELRAAAGLTQAGLSLSAGVPTGTIRDYEQGKREPLLSNAQKLARALGASMDVFPMPANQKSKTKGKPKKKPASRGGK